MTVPHSKLTMTWALLLATGFFMLLPWQSNGQLLEGESWLMGPGISLFQIQSIHDPDQRYGFVVVTGDENDVDINGSTWTRRQEYWTWTVKSPMPPEGWALRRISSNPEDIAALDLRPEGADFIYNADAFPEYTAFDQLPKGRWFTLDFQSVDGAEPVSYGYFRALADGSQEWYGFPVAGSRIAIPEGALLQWTPLAQRPQTIHEAALVYSQPVMEL